MTVSVVAADGVGVGVGAAVGAGAGAGVAVVDGVMVPWAGMSGTRGSLGRSPQLVTGIG